MTDRDAGSLRPRVGWWERLRLLPSPALRAYERRCLGNKDARAGSLTSASTSASSSAYATPRRPAHAPLRAPVAMSPARRPGRSSARIPVAPWRLTHPAIRPQQFDHAQHSGRIAAQCEGLLSALCQGRDRSAARSAVTDNGSYVAYTRGWTLQRVTCSAALAPPPPHLQVDLPVCQPHHEGHDGRGDGETEQGADREHVGQSGHALNSEIGGDDGREEHDRQHPTPIKPALHQELLQRGVVLVQPLRI